MRQQRGRRLALDLQVLDALAGRRGASSAAHVEQKMLRKKKRSAAAATVGARISAVAERVAKRRGAQRATARVTTASAAKPADSASASRCTAGQMQRDGIRIDDIYQHGEYSKASARFSPGAA